MYFILILPFTFVVKNITSDLSEFISFRFNFVAKKLYRRLVQLGAKDVVKPGYADDQHDLGYML